MGAAAEATPALDGHGWPCAERTTQPASALTSGTRSHPPPRLRHPLLVAGWFPSSVNYSNFSLLTSLAIILSPVTSVRPGVLLSAVESNQCSHGTAKPGSCLCPSPLAAGQGGRACPAWAHVLERHSYGPWSQQHRWIKHTLPHNPPVWSTLEAEPDGERGGCLISLKQLVYNLLFGRTEPEESKGSRSRGWIVLAGHLEALIAHLQNVDINCC